MATKQAQAPRDEIKEAGDQIEQAADSFLAVARRVAMDEPVTADAIRRTVQAAGSSVDDFEQLVGQLRHRRELREKQAAHADLLTQRAGIDAAIKAAADELEEAVEQHKRTVPPLRTERDKLTQQINALALVPHELARTCPSPQLQAAKRDAERCVRTAELELAAARENLQRIRRQPTGSAPEDRAYMQQLIGRCEETVSAAERRVAEAAAAAAAAHRALIDF